MTLTQFAFRYRPVTWLIIGSILALGLIAMVRLPRREDPQLSARWIRVMAIYPGANATQVEQLVAERLERGLLEVDSVKSVQTTSRDGQAVVEVEASDYCHDLDRFRQDVRHRVEDTRAELPAGVLSLAVNDRFSDTAAMVVGVWWNGASDAEREGLAKRVRDRIRAIPEADEVTLLGNPQRQIEVALSAQRMAQLAVTPSMVADAISSRNVLPQTGGSMAAGDVRLSIQPGAELAGEAGLADLLVAAPSVYLRDIAEVHRVSQDPPSFEIRVDGHRAIGISTTLRQGRTISVLGRRVREAIDAVTLPPGAGIEIVNDLPTSVEGRMGEFNSNLASGVGLILAVMLAFMGVRAATIVGALLPLTILGTFAGMFMLGRDLQQISITALIIALGLVVDNSVVVVDNIERWMAKGVPGEPAAIGATDEVRVPLLTSNLTTVASFAPLILLSGGVGEFIEDLGIVTTVATLVSLLFNMTVTPMLAARWLRPADRDTCSLRFTVLCTLRQVDRLRDALGRIAAAGLARPGRTVAMGLVGFTVAVLVLPHLGTQFFPSAVRTQFTIDVWLPEGRDIAATLATTTQVEHMLLGRPGVRSVVSYIGQGGPRFYYNINPEAPAANYAQLVVNTVSVDDTRRLVNTMQVAFDQEIPQARVVARTLEQGPPVGAPVAIRLAGEDLSQLRSAGEQIRTMLAAMPGTVSPWQNFGERPLGLRVTPDRDQEALVGLTDADVAQSTRMAWSGTTVSLWREDDEELPIVMRLDPRERTGAGDLADLPVPTRLGTVVPLRQIAGLELVPQEGRIVRRNHVRTLTVYAFTRGRLASDVVAEVQRHLQGHPLSAGISVSFGGEQEEVDRTFTEMLLIFGLTVVANLVIVAWEFNEWAAALTILAAVPLSLTGSVAGLALAGLPFGFMAFLGCTSLGGLVTNHAIVLFEYASQEQRGGLSLDDALLAAGRKRLRPILLTVLLSIGGLLPQALNGGSLWPPMAWSMISGLLMALLLTLVLVPSVYKVLRRCDRITRQS
ncbi:MAG TPA: efflux RND transporter permease subunit [Candidatus Xenobia bacterium]